MLNNKKTGIYVHIPYCKSKCDYCSFNSGTDLSTADKYIEAVIKEAKLINKNKFNKCDTIYIGGGTPSVLPSGKISKIVNCLKENFDIDCNPEITVECNPDSVKEEFVKELKELKVNRVSIGLQSDNDDILKILNRPHKFDDFLNALSLFKNYKIKNISCDLMLGLPNQNIDMLKETINSIASMDIIKHISVYALKIEEGTPFRESGITADEELQADMYEICVNMLKDFGFNRYEVSNFCKKNFESRHNSKYWDLSPYIGLGVSAHSYYNKQRFENTGDINEYIKGNYSLRKYYIDNNESIEEYIMLSLRTACGTDLEFLKNQYNYDLAVEKAKEIKQLTDSGLCNLTDNRLKLGEKSFYILNQIILKLI